MRTQDAAAGDKHRISGPWRLIVGALILAALVAVILVTQTEWWVYNRIDGGTVWNDTANKVVVSGPNGGTIPAGGSMQLHAGSYHYSLLGEQITPNHSWCGIWVTVGGESTLTTSFVIQSGETIKLDCISSGVGP
jgi:hypothetical protein